MSEELEDIEDAEEQTDSQSLAEIELFFDMAMKLEETKFNLYPKDGQEMQQLLIKLVKQRLEWFNFEDDEWDWTSHRGATWTAMPGRA